MSLRNYFMRVNGQTYEELGAGLVRVTEASGTSGVFRVNGEWVEGDLRQANIHMLIYTGGPTIPEEKCRSIRFGPAAGRKFMSDI